MDTHELSHAMNNSSFHQPEARRSAEMNVSVEHGADGGELLPFLKTVIVVCRQDPRVATQQRILRQINRFLDYSLTYSLKRACRNSLSMAQRVFSRTGRDRQQIREGLCEAAREGQLEVVQWLCMVWGGVENAQVLELINGRSGVFESLPVCVAAEGGHLSIVRWLVEYGADVSRQGGGGGLTALHRAVWRGHWPVMTWLIENGASVGEQDDIGRTVLHFAAHGDVSVVRWLVDKGARVSERDADGQTPLAVAAQRGNISVVQFLMEYGVDMDIRDCNGQTALHEAAECGHRLVVQCLVEAGACVNTSNFEGETALHLAARTGNVSLVGFLVRSGGHVHDRDSLGRTALHYAAYLGQAGVVQFLSDIGARLDDKDDHGQTPLHLAVRRGKLSVVEVLVNNGGNVNSKDNRGRIALHEAAIEGHLPLVQYLVDKGAQIREQDDDNRTALHLATNSSKECVDVVEFLVHNGLHPFESDIWCHTALYYAIRRLRFQVVEFLLTKCCHGNQQPLVSDLLLALEAATKAKRNLLLQQLTAKLDTGIR